MQKHHLPTAHAQDGVQESPLPVVEFYDLNALEHWRSTKTKGKAAAHVRSFAWAQADGRSRKGTNIINKKRTVVDELHPCVRNFHDLGPQRRQQLDEALLGGHRQGHDHEPDDGRGADVDHEHGERDDDLERRAPQVVAVTGQAHNAGGVVGHEVDDGARGGAGVVLREGDPKRLFVDGGDDERLGLLADAVYHVEICFGFFPPAAWHEMVSYKTSSSAGRRQAKRSASTYMRSESSSGRADR